MSDSPELKARRSPDIFREVRSKINGLSPASPDSSAPDRLTGPPVEDKASMREMVGKIRQQSKSGHMTQGALVQPSIAMQLSKDAQYHAQITTLYNLLDKENIPAAVDAIDTMGNMMNVAAADVLAILLEYPDEAVRAHAAQTLGMLGQRDSVEPLIRALDDRSAVVCINAAVALGIIGDNRAEIPLQKVPVDNPRVKKAAVAALTRIESRRI